MLRIELTTMMAACGLTTLLLTAASSAAPQSPDIATAVATLLTAEAGDGAGFAIVIEVDDELILKQGFGYANRAERLPFTPETVAQIGSLTKQFTATAVLQLAAAGDLDLHEPIGQYIEGLSPPVADITAHQLLTHSAGLAEYCGDDFDRISFTRFIDRCLDTRLRFPPGTDSAYSNVGYVALAALVTQVSGRSFASYLDARVLGPNGLEKTGHFIEHDPTVVMAHGYRGKRDRGNIADRLRALGDDWWALQGAGGMQASVNDIYAWYKALNGSGSLAADVRKRLTSPHTPWVDGLAEGYGWFFRSDNDERVVQMSHSGSDGVFFCYYWHRPVDNVFVYFVGNSGEERSIEVLGDVLRTVRSGVGSGN